MNDVIRAALERSFSSPIHAEPLECRQLVPIVHQPLVFDNPGVEPQPVFEIRKGQLLNTADEIPI